MRYNTGLSLETRFVKRWERATLSFNTSFNLVILNSLKRQFVIVKKRLPYVCDSTQVNNRFKKLLNYLFARKDSFKITYSQEKILSIKVNSDLID